MEMEADMQGAMPHDEAAETTNQTIVRDKPEPIASRAALVLSLIHI